MSAGEERSGLFSLFTDVAARFLRKTSANLQSQIEVREQRNRVQEWQWQLENRLIPALQESFAARRGEAGGQVPRFVAGANGPQHAWLRVDLSVTRLTWDITEDRLRAAGDSIGYRIERLRPGVSGPPLPRNVRVYLLDFRANH